MNGRFKNASPNGATRKAGSGVGRSRRHGIAPVAGRVFPQDVLNESEQGIRAITRSHCLFKRILHEVGLPTRGVP